MAKQEHYIGRRKTKGQPLCPYCGSPDVYPKKAKRLFFFTRTVGWSCANERCLCTGELSRPRAMAPGEKTARRT